MEKAKKVVSKVKNIKTGEIFKTELDMDIFNVVKGDRGVEVLDMDGKKRMFRRDFLKVEKS